MTSEIILSNIEIDHVSAVSLLDVSEDRELKEGFNWINREPLLKKVMNAKELNLISSTIDYNSSKLINSSE